MKEINNFTIEDKILVILGSHKECFDNELLNEIAKAEIGIDENHLNNYNDLVNNGFIEYTENNQLLLLLLPEFSKSFLVHKSFKLTKKGFEKYTEIAKNLK